MRQLGLDAFEHDPWADNCRESETRQWIAPRQPCQFDGCRHEQTPGEKRCQEKYQIIARRAFVLFERGGHALKDLMINYVPNSARDTTNQHGYPWRANRQDNC